MSIDSDSSTTSRTSFSATASISPASHLARSNSDESPAPPSAALAPPGLGAGPAAAEAIRFGAAAGSRCCAPGRAPGVRATARRRDRRGWRSGRRRSGRPGRRWSSRPGSRSRPGSGRRDGSRHRAGAPVRPARTPAAVGAAPRYGRLASASLWIGPTISRSATQISDHVQGRRIQQAACSARQPVMVAVRFFGDDIDGIAQPVESSLAEQRSADQLFEALPQRPQRRQQVAAVDGRDVARLERRQAFQVVPVEQMPGVTFEASASSPACG